MNAIIALIDRLRKAGRSSERMQYPDIKLLCQIQETDIDIISDYFRAYDSCIGGLIIYKYGKDEFCRILDILKGLVSKKVFRWITDSNLEGHPLDDSSIDLDCVFDIIDRYYDSRYSLIYDIYTCKDCPTRAHYIIEDDVNGIHSILEKLKGRQYTKDQFDIDMLYSIWSEYHVGKLCSICHRKVNSGNECPFCDLRLYDV